MASNYEFIKTDPEEIVSSMLERYEGLTGVTVQPGSPERLFIEWAASLVVQERVMLNFVGNQNIPSRASGQNLDALAELFGIPARPAATAAVCTIRFTLQGTYANPITIPNAVVMADASGNVNFVTQSSVTILAGQTTGDVTAVCTVRGKSGNGYAAGQINTVVGTMPDFVASAVNTDATSGGADEATDDEFYQLMRQSMNTFSTAGAQGAYEYFARSVSTEIGDVTAMRAERTVAMSVPVWTDADSTKKILIASATIHLNTLKVYTADPEDSGVLCAEGMDYEVDETPLFDDLVSLTVLEGGALENADDAFVSFFEDKAGEVTIFALMKDGTIPSTAIKDKILAACSARNVRPLTDKVVIGDPVTQTFTIDADYYTSEDSDISVSEIEKNVAEAVNEYVEWQTAKLGRDINPSKLIALLMGAGVKRVVVRQPTFVPVSVGAGGAPVLPVLSGSPSVTNMGIEDD